MKIGEHEVQVISKYKVKVGCQEVTRSEIEAVLEKMKDAKLELRVGEKSSRDVGSVWLQQLANGIVRMNMRAADGNTYSLLDVSMEGITRHSYCGSTGLPVVSEDGRFAQVKLVK